jgi:signal transduction histidine kinase
MNGEPGQSAVARTTSSLSVPARGTLLAVGPAGGRLTPLCTALQAEGYEVVVTASVHDAAELLRVRAVDCVLVPFGSDDHDECAQMAAAGVAGQVPVLAAADADRPGLVVAALGAGADDCAPAADVSLLKARLGALVGRKRAADQAARLAADEAAALARKERELSSLNYAISHDLRAPLRAIDGFSRILREECRDSIDARHAGYLERISAAANELGTLIDDLLQLSRVGRAELRPGPVDLSDMARRAVADLQERSNRVVEVVIDDGLVAYGDRRLLRIALEHLIGNCWKFTATSHAARVEFRSREAAGQSEFTIADNGVGFDQAQADKLFQPFQRLHGREFPGTGIGLAVVHKIIDRHGGRIRAEGQVGQGACFSFTLPAGRDGDTQ